MKHVKILAAVSALACAFGTVHAAPVSSINSDTPSQREAGEGPRGGDIQQPGDDRGRRRGKAIESYDQIAREGSEGPRGGDRPGDDRGRGRGKSIESYDQLAREAGEGPRGGDRPGDDRGRGRGKG